MLLGGRVKVVSKNLCRYRFDSFVLGERISVLVCSVLEIASARSVYRHGWIKVSFPPFVLFLFEFFEYRRQ